MHLLFLILINIVIKFVRPNSIMIWRSPSELCTKNAATSTNRFCSVALNFANLPWNLSRKSNSIATPTSEERTALKSGREREDIAKRPTKAAQQLFRCMKYMIKMSLSLTETLSKNTINYLIAREEFPANENNMSITTFKTLSLLFN